MPSVVVTVLCPANRLISKRWYARGNAEAYVRMPQGVEHQTLG